MIALLGALLTAMAVAGGAYVGERNLALGLVLIIIGSVGLGILVASIQSAARNIDRFDTREGLTVGQLHEYLLSASSVSRDTRVFVGDVGLHPAGAVFACILDGHRTVVIERRNDEPAKGHHCNNC